MTVASTMSSTVKTTRLCKVCEEPIPSNRLAALPHATTCVACSTEQPVRGFMSWEHKTAPRFQLVSADNHEWLQKNTRRKPSAQLPMQRKP